MDISKSDDASTPNAETILAFKEVEDMDSGKVEFKTFNSVEDMFKDILGEE